MKARINLVIASEWDKDRLPPSVEDGDEVEVVGFVTEHGLLHVVIATDGWFWSLSANAVRPVDDKVAA